MDSEQTLAWMVPAIIALTYLPKGKVRDEALPLIASVIGMALSIGWALLQGWPINNDVMILGVIASASAMGTYAGVKTVASGVGLGKQPDATPQHSHSGTDDQP